ncbi:MAG TPA: hypothetical protein VM686_26020 [Polyangiaceae bacterium]|nr:hypothetical protein [Polyangiaceae bacterium]
MRALRCAVLLGSLLAVASACDSETSGFLSCGQEVCGPRQECVTVEQGVGCACLPGYLGEACDVCEFGYRRTLEGECELIVIDCDDNPGVCGDHAECVSDEQEDFCACDLAYEGRLCESCVEGYQDNDLDGSCEPRCSQAGLDCEAPTRCSDASGTPECVCPTGYVGESCEQCAVGYRDYEGDCVLSCEAADLECGPREVCDDSGAAPRCVCLEGYSGPACDGCATGYHLDQPTGACLPGCELAELDCGAHGECSEALGFAACSCDLGHAGEQCERCATGYTLETDDTCRFAPAATHTLLADVSIDGHSQLVALDPVSGETVVVGEQHVGGLAGGTEFGTTYALATQTVSLLDLPTGTQTDVAMNVAASPALAFDAARERLYAIGSSAPHSLLFIDPAAGSVAPQSDTGLAGVMDLAYDTLNDRLLVLGEGLSAVDLVTAEVTALPDPPPATRGIAFAADGTLYALAATDLTPEESRIEACRQTAAGLGLLGYAAAAGSVLEPAPDDASLALDSLQAADVEVVAYLGRGLNAEERTVTITSDNADAVLCLELREPTTIVVQEASRFRALIAYTTQSDIEIDVDDAFSAGASPTIHLGAIAPSFLYANPAAIREYTPEEWQALRLPIDPRFNAPGPGVLHVLDTTFASTSSVPLSAGVRPFGTLTAWSPAP